MKSLSLDITFNKPTNLPTLHHASMYFFKKRVDKTNINFHDKQARIQHAQASCAVTIQFGP